MQAGWGIGVVASRMLICFDDMNMREKRLRRFDCNWAWQG